jgi:glycosyltransferase involved in cell wall biosynthesis
MDVAIVASAPVPYTIGGAENLYRWLHDEINARPEHQAEIFKVPSREYGFWPVLEAYERFASLDLTGFDIVVSMKYPAWMVSHREHVLYLLHPLRNVYDFYPLHLPAEVPDPPRAAAELLELMAAHPGDRDKLEEVFDRLDDLRHGARTLPVRLFEFPGPFIRAIVHWLDGVGRAPSAIARYGALSARVRDRADYFPEGVDVTVVHPPTGQPGLAPGVDAGYIFAASRLEEHKRVGMIIDAMQHCGNPDARLIIAGGGPQEDELRARAAADARIELVGRVPDARLVELYAGARAVAFVPEDEDYGYIALEGMLCGRPVITSTDAGGPTELVTHERTGLVVEPTPAAVGAAIERLTADAALAHRLGNAALARAAEVRWERLVDLVVGT